MRKHSEVGQFRSQLQLPDLSPSHTLPSIMHIPVTRSVHRVARPDTPRNRHLPRLLEMGDEDLMELFQQGTLKAFEILVSRYREPLAHYLYRFVADSRECEDLLQETFLRVYRNRLSYRRIARFSTWLYTIAGNLARSEYRKRKRRRMSSLQSLNRNDEEYELEIPDDQELPDQHADESLQTDYVLNALEQIPEDFREVVVLRDVQHLAYEEIADITGLPMGTVKSRINRGRAKLQLLLTGLNVTPGTA